MKSSTARAESGSSKPYFGISARTNQEGFYDCNNKPLFQVAGGVNSQTALDIADNLLNCVRRILRDAIAIGNDDMNSVTDRMFAAEFMVETAQALYSSTNNLTLVVPVEKEVH